LRERPEEIPIFLQYFMQRFAAQLGRAPRAYSPKVLEACMRHPWPGNVRELENFVKRFLILGNEELAVVNSTNGHEQVSSPKGTGSSNERWSLRAVKAEAEKEAILQALEETRWRRKDAAQRLRISMKALYNKLRLYGINTGDGDELPLQTPELPGPNYATNSLE
jgi:DNA-binding NtrC family response regulator